MRSAGVVIAQPCRHSFGSLGRALEGSGVEPFAQGCLDEAFGLAVGAWRVWPGSLVADAAICECLSKEPAFVGRAVVGHDALDLDAMALEEPSARSRKAVALVFFSSGRISV